MRSALGSGIVRLMASANLDLVRSIYADWERGDFSRADWAHPEIEYVVPGGPEPGTWTGIAAMADAFHDQLRAWEDFRVEATEFRELEDERVLALVRFRASGKTSAVEADQEGAELFHVRDCKVTRLVAHWDRDRALADLGLEE
jgi:ketosteroid isomerase-like protein